MSRLPKAATLLLATLLLVTPALAREYTAGTLDDDARVSVLSSTADDTLLRFEVGHFRLQDIPVNGQIFSRIGWSGGAEHLDTGRPALPGFRESLAIPDDARMALTIVDAQYTDFPGVRIIPSKGPITRDVLPQDVPWTFGPDYTNGAWYPAENASLGEPYILRDVRGVVVGVEPFQWNPATGTLRVYHRIDVRVTAVGAGQVNVLAHRPAQRVAEFEAAYERHFLNYGADNLGYLPVGEVGSMLVIAYDAFLAATQPLVDWKNRMGLPTTLVPLSQVGATASQLKAYIQNAYDSQGVCFFILVGDGPQVPYFTNGGGAADPMLSLLAGADSYPDAFVGRISAQTVAQVETQVQRIVEYESAPDPAGTWYSKGVAIASNEGAGIGDDGEADWEHAQNYRVDLLGFTYDVVNELYDGTHPSPGDGTGNGDAGVDRAGNPSSGELVNLLNEGRGLVHYTGHGSATSWVTTGFNNGSINSLTNDNKLPFVVSVGCVNGEFMNTTCFAETWMQATNGGEPTGAITCYASTVNQQWATPMRAQDEMIDLMCTSEKRTWGGLCFNGSCDMIDTYGANGISEFKNWTIFGDPSLRVRTDTPAAVAVSHEGAVNPATGYFDVTTAPFALVGLSDGGTFVGSAFADAGGFASVTFAPSALDGVSAVTLTVTAFNGIPNTGTVAVASGTAAPIIATGGGGIRAEPNPFAAATALSFALDREQAVRLDVFDVTGRHVRSVQDAVLPPGGHRLTWDGTNDAGRSVPSGSYFYRLITADGVETQRVVRIR